MNNNISIRQIDGEEMLDLLFWLDHYAFYPTPPFPDRDEWEKRMKTRVGTDYYAVFEGEKGVAITACPKFTQNIRGEIYQMGGFAAVSTHPEARRKGYSRNLLQHTFEVLVDQGNVFSSLYPFRESFYERLGYVTFPQTRQAIFDPSAMVPLLKGDFDGSVELHSFGDAYDEYHVYTQEMQPLVHGMAMFIDFEGQKEAAKNPRSWMALARVRGEVEGLMYYSLKGDEMMNYDFRAQRFYYRSSQAKYLLLSWLARHVGQAGKVHIWLPSYEHPNTWFPDIRPKLEPAFVAPMGRVLDVKEIGGIQTNPGSFTARVTDPHCPWNNGIWSFDGNSGILEVTPGSGEDFTLTIQGLSALVYGVSDPGDFPYRGWGDPPVESQKTLREMLPQKLPYLHEYY